MRNCYFLSGLGPLQVYHNCTTMVVQLWYNCGGPRPDMRVSQTGHERLSRRVQGTGSSHFHQVFVQLRLHETDTRQKNVLL